MKRLVRAGLLVLTGSLVAATLPLAGPAAADTGSCGSNPIVCENALPGTPMNQWYTPSAYGAIQGFTTAESVQAGDTLQMKVSSPTAYNVKIFRLGWYQGDGARLMPSSPTQVFPAVAQPNCLSDTSTGLTDCGNWSVTATWAVPSDAVSGLYLAEFDATDGSTLMPYPFVVRNEASHSDIVVQTSDEAWEAYNMFGGNDVYQGNGPALDGRAYAVSYNRPLNVSGYNGIYGSEFAMIQWLERNGYDVSYLSGIDVSTNGSLLLNHKVFVSSGHDEYWNQAQVNNVLAARKAGVNEAFFSGNEVFWHTRLAPSIDGSNTPNRTMVTYKMTKMEQKTPDGVADPSGEWTGTWMDPASANYPNGYQPQNELTGSLFCANGYNAEAITVPAQFGNLRLWANTSVATLQPGQVATFQTGTLGYEWDCDTLNAQRPQGEIDLSSTTVNLTNGTLLLDAGNTYGNGNATHSLVEFRDPTSHALVFGAGTVQWSWGLDTVHTDTTTTEDPRMQQATVNLLADMGAQPQTLQSGLVLATQSTDTVGPNVTVTTPTSGTTLPALSPVTISGKAADVGGGVVARVEISVDGGQTWQPATTADQWADWTYTWTPTALGNFTIEVRGEDDSVNIGPVVNVPVTVGPQQCPCTVWPASASPAKADSGDGSAVEVGVKFQTTAPTSATGVTFYKSAANTGTHTGSLWTASGTLLATGTFGNETASGWQTMNFSSPVPLKANTTYVAGYYAPVGHYSADAGTFTSQGAGLPPVEALQAGGTNGGDGIYKYSSTAGVFPSNASGGNTNYWVSPIVSTSGVSTNPPAVTSTTPAASATGASIIAPVTATFNEGIDNSTLAFTLKDSTGATVPAGVSYNMSTDTATLTPNSQLNIGASYTASIQASDMWGNAMTSPTTWSFTTSTAPPPVSCPCSVWGGNSTPGTPDTTSDSNSVELGMRFQSAVAGYVTGVSFYKGTGNIGTHTGTLWSNSGTQLATGTFTNETASGWQTMTFASPVAISANTTYVVSYHAPKGNYAADKSYFTSAHANYPLTALANGTGSANGVYRYGASTVFPTGTSSSTNYWVDVQFATSVTSSAVTSPSAAGTTTLAAATSSAPAATQPITVALPKAIQPATLDITVSSATGYVGTESPVGTPIAGTISYDPASQTAVFHPSAPLPAGADYRVTVSVEDTHGNALPTRTWTFTVPLPHTAPPGAPTGPSGGEPLPATVIAADQPGAAIRRTDPVPTLV